LRIYLRWPLWPKPRELEKKSILIARLNMNSKQFYTKIVKLIDEYGSDKVVAAARLAETSRNQYKYVSRDPRDFRWFTQPRNAARPKQYKDCYITQDYENLAKGRIFVKIRRRLRTL